MEEETKRKGSIISRRDLLENKGHTMRRPSRHLPGAKNGTEDKSSEKESAAGGSHLSSSKCSSRDTRLESLLPWAPGPSLFE